MNKLILTLLCLLPLHVLAENIDTIAGKYEYKQFQVVNPAGKVLGLADFGVKTITLEIKRDGQDRKLISSMQMVNGDAVKESGLIQRIGLKDKTGYWIAKWQDMSYPVRAEFKLDGDELSYEIKFQEASDKARFGLVERATLSRTK